MSNGENESHEAPPDVDPVEGMIVQLLHTRSPARDSVLGDLCERHPEHAAALRRRCAFLRAAGLLDPPDVSSGPFPEQIGGFRLLRRLGQGGMGVVYLAEQQSLDRKVALKMIQPGAAAPPRARERFRREVQAVSLLDHPNICQVFDAGEIEGVPYLAMRYVEGETLADRIARRSAVTGRRSPVSDRDAIDEVVEMAEKLARALHAAHEKGLVHRDVKPRNVMLESSTGEPLLLDFGLARLDDGDTPTLTLSGDQLGTPAYMAPEQVAGRAVDRRTDVYALGATLYEALTGRVPHEAPTREALYRRILAADITAASRHNPHVPRDLGLVIATALDRDPGRRYRTAAEFADDLQRVREHKPILARPPSAWLRARRWCQRNPYAATALGLLAAGLVATFLLLQERSRTLTRIDAALQVQRALEMRGSNPGESLRMAWNAAQSEPSPSPPSVAAVRAALHAPQVEIEIEAPSALTQAFDVDRTGGLIVWQDQDRRFWLWNSGTLVDLGAPSGDYNGFCARLAPDGQRIAFAGNDAPVYVFGTDGSRLAELPAPEPAGTGERVFSVAWHPSRNLLAVGTGDAGSWRDSGARVHLWDLDADEILWTKPLGAWPWHLSFVDEDHLAVAPGCVRWTSQPAFRDHRVWVFPVDGGAGRSHLAHDQPCMEMAISDGWIATVGHDRRLALWDWARGGKPVVFEHPARVYTVDFAPRGRTLVTACEDGKVRFFDRRGEPVGEWAAHGAMPVYSAVFHPDGRRVLVRLRDRRLLLTTDGRQLAQLPATRFVVRTDRFLEDGRLVAFEERGVRLWRLEPDGLETRFLAEGVLPIPSPDGSRLLALDFDGRAVLSNEKGGVIWRASLPPLWPCVDGEDRAYSASDDRRLVVVSPQGQPDPVRNDPYYTNQVIWYLGCAPRGALVASSGGGVNMRVIRPEGGVWTTAAFMDLPDAEGERVLRAPLLWTRGPEADWRILAGTNYGVLECAFAGDELKVVGTLLEEHLVANVAVSSDGRSLAVDLGTKGTRLFVREGGAWEERAALDHTMSVVRLTFVRDDRVAMTSPDTVRIYDLDLKLVGQLPKVDEVGFSSAHPLPGGQKILTIAGNYLMRPWWIDDARVMEEAERRLVK